MKCIWTLITPEGKEFVIGAYITEGTATAAAKHRLASDYLRLCAYPLMQRAVKDGETVKPWSPWTGE